MNSDDRLDHVIPSRANRDRVRFHADAVNVDRFVRPAGGCQVRIHRVLGDPRVIGIKVLDVKLPVIGIDDESQ
ncbi:hypothetical protein [Streptomyces roseolus]|uniref:hypothetical protein n=1 Tax=Streptomyces roseolus TaxID=67358 RepID=UPI0036F18BB2